MLVFISWSGEKSRAIARALHNWLPKVIQAVKPWMSDKDIEAGAFWDDQIRSNAHSAEFLIVCVTSENVRAPWLNYEAGAIAERLKGRACPYLIGVSKNQLGPAPLSRLQAKESTETETLELVKAVNSALGERRLEPRVLEDTFRMFWPELASGLETLPMQSQEDVRSDSDKLNEILAIVQAQRAATAALVENERSRYLARVFGAGPGKPPVGRAPGDVSFYGPLLHEDDAAGEP